MGNTSSPRASVLNTIVEAKAREGKEGSEEPFRSPRGLSRTGSERPADVSPRSPRALQLRDEEVKRLLAEKEKGEISLKSPRSPRMPAQASNLNNIKKKLHLKSKSEVMTDAGYSKDHIDNVISPRSNKSNSLKANNAAPTEDSLWTKELAQRYVYALEFPQNVVLSDGI